MNSVLSNHPLFRLRRHLQKIPAHDGVLVCLMKLGEAFQVFSLVHVHAPVPIEVIGLAESNVMILSFGVEVARWHEKIRWFCAPQMVGLWHVFE